MTAGEVRVQRLVKARPSTVYEYFTDPAKWLSWQGVEATIEPWPGGVFRMNVTGDGYASGQFVTLDPPHRVVFTWGWEAADRGMPPGSSTVEVDLVAADDGAATLVALRHTGLPLPAVEPHRHGWGHYLGRLGVAAAGADPGPDPFRVSA